MTNTEHLLAISLSGVPYKDGGRASVSLDGREFTFKVQEQTLVCFDSSHEYISEPIFTIHNTFAFHDTDIITIAAQILDSYVSHKNSYR